MQGNVHARPALQHHRGLRAEEGPHGGAGTTAPNDNQRRRCAVAISRIHGGIHCAVIGAVIVLKYRPLNTSSSCSIGIRRCTDRLSLGGRAAPGEQHQCQPAGIGQQPHSHTNTFVKILVNFRWEKHVTPSRARTRRTNPRPASQSPSATGIKPSIPTMTTILNNKTTIRNDDI